MTSWPLCARYHALVVPITPAPRTTTLMPASDKKQKGESLRFIPPVLARKLILQQRFARHAGVGTATLTPERIYTFDLRTASSPFAALIKIHASPEAFSKLFPRICDGSNPMRLHRVCTKTGTERVAYFPV